MTHSRLTALAVVFVVVPLGLAEGGECGHLTGRFYYDGEPPPARTVVVTKDTALQLNTK
jgi:hypothetical protein